VSWGQTWEEEARRAVLNCPPKLSLKAEALAMESVKVEHTGQEVRCSLNETNDN